LSHKPQSSRTNASAFVRRTARAVKIVVRHRAIPRPLRWLAGFALLPIPGPFDEAVLLVVAAILFVFYRRELQQAWREAAERTG
jgi:hypothetical protein